MKHIPKIPLLVFLAALTFLSFTLKRSEISEKSRAVVASTPKNIIFILADDHRYDAMGFTGKFPGLKTPALDRMAREGAHLQNAFVATSLCSPSRATILTGQYPHKHTIVDNQAPMPKGLMFFPNYLQKAGYKTAFLGKWHMGDGEGHNPEGFDYWDVLIEQGEYFEPRFLSAEGLRIEPGYATDVITDLALSWMDDPADDRPWCILINHKAPHRSWEPHPKHVGMYSDPIPVPETFSDDLATHSSATHRATMRVAARSKPARVPSASMMFRQISPAPSA